MSEPFGPCQLCGAPSCVRINGTPYCVDHISDGMARALRPVREWRNGHDH